jgi:outer membrane receptor for ferric coprogen and ferric-rhodotorulic acid
MTAVSQADIEARGLSDFRSIAQETPGVSMKTSGPGQTEFEMRGLTSIGGFSPTVGFYVDDAPLTAPAQAAQGKVVIDPDLYDLQRVEVLRGPQGTLYRSGSMGGTIKLITNPPQLNKFAVSARAERARSWNSAMPRTPASTRRSIWRTPPAMMSLSTRPRRRASGPEDPTRRCRSAGRCSV